MGYSVEITYTSLEYKAKISPRILLKTALSKRQNHATNDASDWSNLVTHTTCSTLNKNLYSKSTYFLKLTHQESWRSNGFLKGQSQLIHMRIRYHFVADLRVSEDSQNKPCGVELVTSEVMIIDFKPYLCTHFLYTIEHSPMDLSKESRTSTNTPEFDHGRSEK